MRYSPLEHDALVQRALILWDVPSDAVARCINISENRTYLVEASGFRSVLRLHRRGYHSRQAIASELDWMTALGREGVVSVPSPIPGLDGDAIQTVDGHQLVMFSFLEGAHPSESGDLAPLFRLLGLMAAQTHLHAVGWQRPQGFTRHSWNTGTVFGPSATWGDWREAPNVTPAIRAVLDRVEACVVGRLESFGRGNGRYGLIHADMRLANLLIEGETTHLIDFDDCGFGWFLYDFAAAISFIEDHPQVPDLRTSWVEGYRQIRDLPDAEEAEIDSFVMLRRLALLAWIGSHIESTEPQALAPYFAEASACLGESYLMRFG